MKPVLMVDGVACKVLELDYNQDGKAYRVKAVINGQVQNLRETEDDSYPNRYDITNNLVYQNRYDEVFKSIDKLRKEVVAKMSLLALEHIKEDSQSQKMLLKQQFEATEQRAIALEDALDKISEFMYKDVLK